jgi:hypothetical protein
MPRNEVASIGWHRDVSNANPHRGSGKTAVLPDHCATARVSDIPTERLRFHPESAVAIGGLSLGRSANANRPAGGRRASRVGRRTSGENLTPAPFPEKEGGVGGRFDSRCSQQRGFVRWSSTTSNGGSGRHEPTDAPEARESHEHFSRDLGKRRRSTPARGADVPGSHRNRHTGGENSHWICEVVDVCTGPTEPESADRLPR